MISEERQAEINFIFRMQECLTFDSVAEATWFFNEYDRMMSKRAEIEDITYLAPLKNKHMAILDIGFDTRNYFKEEIVWSFYRYKTHDERYEGNKVILGKFIRIQADLTGVDDRSINLFLEEYENYIEIDSLYYQESERKSAEVEYIYRRQKYE